MSHIHHLHTLIETDLLAKSTTYINGESPGMEDAVLFAHLVQVLTAPGLLSLGRSDSLFATRPALQRHLEAVCDLYFRGEGGPWQVCDVQEAFIYVSHGSFLIVWLSSNAMRLFRSDAVTVTGRRPCWSLGPPLYRGAGIEMVAMSIA